MTDIGINSDGTFLTKNGDFMPVESDGQHIQDILLSNKGTFAFSPLTGVGITDYINSPNTLKQRNALKKLVSVQLRYDGFTPKSINVNDISNPQIQV